MLKVLPIQSKSEQEALCVRCNIEYDPDMLAYLATVNDEVVGICQFKVTAEGGIIRHIAKVADRPEPQDPAAREKADLEALFVMGRGALNFIDLCGVKKAAYIGEITNEPLLRAIGFKPSDNGEYTVNLEGFFTDHCH